MSKQRNIDNDCTKFFTSLGKSMKVAEKLGVTYNCILYNMYNNRITYRLAQKIKEKYELTEEQKIILIQLLTN